MTFLLYAFITLGRMSLWYPLLELSIHLKIEDIVKLIRSNNYPSNNNSNNNDDNNDIYIIYIYIYVYICIVPYDYIKL